MSQLNLDVTPPDMGILAQMIAPIGSITSASLLLENPRVSFKVSNENPISFQLSCRNIVSLGTLEKKRIELRYVPSSIGDCERDITQDKQATAQNLGSRSEIRRDYFYDKPCSDDRTTTATVLTYKYHRWYFVQANVFETGRLPAVSFARRCFAAA